MVYRRPPEGERLISLQLPCELIDYLDKQAKSRTLSRAAMVRQLILAARDRSEHAISQAA
jgi:hypothetical protein